MNCANDSQKSYSSKQKVKHREGDAGSNVANDANYLSVFPAVYSGGAERDKILDLQALLDLLHDRNWIDPAGRNKL